MQYWIMDSNDYCNRNDYSDSSEWFNNAVTTVTEVIIVTMVTNVDKIFVKLKV